MTDADDLALARAWLACPDGPAAHHAQAAVARLVEEVARLRLLNVGLVGRCAACAEVLSRVASRRNLVCEVCQRRLDRKAT